MSKIDVLWLGTAGLHPVGIVRAYDEIEHCWKYYIGAGEGRDEEEDIACIMNWGQKFYNLNFLVDFCNIKQEGQR